MFEANSFATSQLIRRRQAASCACSEATNESVCAFIGQSIGCATLHPLPGDNSCVEPPDPIPNSEVKRARADGSVHLACESRSLPGSLPRNPAALAAGFLFVRWFFLFQDSAGCLPGAGELAAEAAPAGFGYFAARSPGAARDRGQRTVGGSPPTMTTSAGRLATRPPQIGRAACRARVCLFVE